MIVQSVIRIAQDSAGASRMRLCYMRARAGLAQMVEHLICNQGVTGSIPVAGTTQLEHSSASTGTLARVVAVRRRLFRTGLVELHVSYLVVEAWRARLNSCVMIYYATKYPDTCLSLNICFQCAECMK